MTPVIVPVWIPDSSFRYPGLMVFRDQADVSTSEMCSRCSQPMVAASV